VAWRRSLDAVVLLPPAAPEPVSLAGTAALVWDLLAEPASVSELVDALAEHFGDDPARITRDVDALLARLSDLGAVEAGP
jgi:hypothetical protein